MGVSVLEFIPRNMAWRPVICFLAFAYLTRKKYPKIKGIYSQDHGLWFGVKYVVAFALYALRSALLRILRRINSKNSEQGAWDSPNEFLKDDRFAINSWGLLGGDKHGNVLSVRMCRRLEGRMEILLILRLADGQTFTHPVHPDTLVLDETPYGDEAEDAFMAGAGMRFRVNEPARTYRFAYAGLMRLQSPDDINTQKQQATPRCIEVDIRVWFRALADPAEFSIDGHPESFAESLANEDWSKLDFEHFSLWPQTLHYQQAGEIRGFLKVTNEGLNERVQNVPLDLYGMRIRSRGRLDWSAYHKYLAHYGTFENGESFSLIAVCDLESITTHLIAGFLMKPNGFVYAVSWYDIHLANFPDAPKNLTTEYVVHFVANRQMYTLKVNRLSSVTVSQGDSWEAVVFVSPARFELNGLVGSGFVEYEHKNNGHLVVPKHRPGVSDIIIQSGPKTGIVRNLTLPPAPTPESGGYPFCLSLEESLCCLSALTGGKSAKLAMLLRTSRPDSNFIVPAGFALTVHSFGRQLDAVAELRAAVNDLLAACGYGQYRAQWRVVQPSVQKMQASCDRAVSLFTATPLIPEVKNAIRCYMERVFGPEWQSVFVAVRSSAVGEDGAEASAAGQMETYLHIQGEQAIEEAIRKCWASNFDFRALQYRRKICGKLDPSMGVLIQRLVPAETAGVMFTRDPTNGSMARMIINASFGVGEGVVSGVVEPDTITVHRHDFIDPERLDVVYTHIGSKRRTNSNEDNHLCCLSEENVQRLAKVGVVIEQMFGSARDIEWAIAADEDSAKKGLIGKTKIYILQARPITTMDAEEDWELEREFDTAIGSADHEWITSGNVQEMMPGPLTPLSGRIWVDAFSQISEEMQVQVGIRPWRRIHVPRAMGLFYQHIFFNYSLTAGSATSAPGKRTVDMAIFGELKPFLPSLQELYTYVDNTSFLLNNVLHNLAYSLSMFSSERAAQRFEQMLDATYTPHATEPEFLYQQIVDSMPTIRRGWAALLDSCTRPIACQMALLSLINADSSTWSTNDVADLTILYSTVTDMFTGDVPMMIRAMAIAITKAGCRNSFLEMDNTLAADWLVSNAPQATEPRRLFIKFMQKHGHRCVREAELREKCWRQQPEKLVEAIKAVLGVQDFEANMDKPTTKPEVPVDEAIDSLSRPVGPRKRKFMRWLLPIARRSVGRREWGKNLAIRSMEASRFACHRLGVLMTERGLLPDEDLVFFFTLQELGQLIRRRSPKLIFKAMRRRRIQEQLKTFEFDEIIHGYPKPVSSDTDVTTNVRDTKVAIKGIPIGTGSIEGIARVLTSFEQAHEIRNGEILVVPYTDVGWTPYFSLITGLITELGGLLSHGSVIAREYGLPCLVGCKRATRFIPNGARIRIDCKNATLTIIDSNVQN